jgi:hypothetical protein
MAVSPPPAAVPLQELEYLAVASRGFWERRKEAQPLLVVVAALVVV